MSKKRIILDETGKAVTSEKEDLKDIHLSSQLDKATKQARQVGKKEKKKWKNYNPGSLGFIPKSGMMVCQEIDIKPINVMSDLVDQEGKKIIPEGKSMADYYDEHPIQAKVMAIGGNFKDDKFNVKIGDIIALDVNQRHVMLPIILRKQEYFIAPVRVMHGVLKRQGLIKRTINKIKLVFNL